MKKLVVLVDKSSFSTRKELAIALEYLGLYIDITRPLDFYEIIESLALHGIYVTNIKLLLEEYNKVLDNLEERRKKTIDKIFAKKKCNNIEELKYYFRREAELGYKKEELENRALYSGWNIKCIKRTMGSLRGVIVKRNRNFLQLWKEEINNTNHNIEVVYT